jgi:hypothetical protein
VVQGGRTRRGAALEVLVGKYCGPRAPLPPTGPEVEGELARHVLLVERKAEVLGHQLEQVRPGAVCVGCWWLGRAARGSSGGRARPPAVVLVLCGRGRALPRWPQGVPGSRR